MSKKSTDKATHVGAKSKDNVTIGEDPKKSAVDQALEARGEDKKSETKESSKADGNIVGDKFLSDEQKRSDVLTEGRLAVSERTGNFAAVPDANAGHTKVGDVKEHKKFAGWLTCTGVSHETGQEISTRMHIPEDMPVTEEGVFYRFKCHHDSAVRDGFKIDAENKDDPLLRTDKG